jgi:tripartite-type tricarboxylate transporter receptor subunit TctC
MHRNQVFRHAIAASAMLFMGVDSTYAQSYPNQPIRFIVPYAAGGGVDMVARAVGPTLSERLGQPVVIDNRGGAGGNIGTELAARAEPNGYTIVMGAAALAINTSLYRKLPFDPVKDFVPISLISATPNILAVHPTIPAKSVRQLIQLAKAKPGSLNYGSAGNGTTSHLALELFKTMAGVEIVHIPYKGTAPAVVGLLGGEVAMMLAPALTLISHVRSKKVNGLAVSSLKRLPAIPELPTIAESGVPGFEARQWYGVLAPTGTPKAIVMRLNSEIVKIVDSPEVTKRFMSEGSEPIGSTPEEFARHLKAEIAKWTKAVAASGARVD